MFVLTSFFFIIRLTVQVGVFCDDNWYGPRCVCHPMSNDTGHYYCAANGSKICHPNFYYGQDCNIFCKADKELNDHYNCSLNGTKICHQNWYGSIAQDIANHPQTGTDLTTVDLMGQKHVIQVSFSPAHRNNKQNLISQKYA